MWERKPSVCVKLKLSSRISALKNKQTKKKVRWVHGSQRLYIELICLVIKFYPSELIQQSAQIGWVFQLCDTWLLIVVVINPSQFGQAASVPHVWGQLTAGRLRTVPLGCVHGHQEISLGIIFSLRTVADGSFSNNKTFPVSKCSEVSCHTELFTSLTLQVFSV